MSEEKEREHNVELLKIYLDEWKYRLDKFRNHLGQIVVLIFFTSSLPITVNIFGDIEIPNIPLAVFPITGILFSVVFLVYCLSEAARIATLDTQIKLIIRDNFSEKYAKTALVPIMNGKLAKILNHRMAIWVPISLALIEVIIAVVMIILIFNNAI